MTIEPNADAGPDFVRCEVSPARAGSGKLVLHLAGAWTLQNHIPPLDQLGESIEPFAGTSTIGFDSRNLTGWDSGFLTFMMRLLEYGKQAGMVIDLDGLPKGARGLLDLATAVPERAGARREVNKQPFLTVVGKQTLGALESSGKMISFLGEATLAFVRLLGGRTQFRRGDLLLIAQECGANALPIVTLISVLIGLILAFVGAVQLRQFGAQIYVADLVGIAMAREMGAIMTAIIMAGRTGAAIVVRRSLASVLLFFSLQIIGAHARAEERDVATEYYRAGQDSTLDLNVDFDALHYESSDPMADNHFENVTPGWDRHPRVDWSRRAGKSWELDPVLLHRRQAGQPERQGEDLSDKTLGIELRRRF